MPATQSRHQQLWEMYVADETRTTFGFEPWLAERHDALEARVATLTAALTEMLSVSVDESRTYHYDGDRRIENFRDSCPFCVARAALAKAGAK